MRSRAKGRLIVVEGIDGVGKSTFANLLVKHLEERGIASLYTKEPASDTVALQRLRSVLLEHRWSLQTEALLHSASRAEHVACVMIPSLEKGLWVVCDRFVDSFMIYQGETRYKHTISKSSEGGGGALPHLSAEHLAMLVKLSTGGLTPSLTFFLDAPLPQLQKRLEHRGEAKSFYEQLGEEFFLEAQRVYQSQVQKYPEKYHILDAKQSPQILVEKAWEKLSSLGKAS